MLDRDLVDHWAFEDRVGLPAQRGDVEPIDGPRLAEMDEIPAPAGLFRVIPLGRVGLDFGRPVDSWRPFTAGPPDTAPSAVRSAVLARAARRPKFRAEPAARAAAALAEDVLLSIETFLHIFSF